MKTELTNGNFSTETQNGHKYQIVKGKCDICECVFESAAVMLFFGLKVKISFPGMVRKKGQEPHSLKALKPNSCLQCALRRPSLNYCSLLNAWKRLCNKLNISPASWSGFAYGGT